MLRSRERSCHPLLTPRTFSKNKSAHRVDAEPQFQERQDESQTKSSGRRARASTPLLGVEALFVPGSCNSQSVLSRSGAHFCHHRIVRHYSLFPSVAKQNWQERIWQSGFGRRELTREWLRAHSYRELPPRSVTATFAEVLGREDRPPHNHPSN